MCIYAYSVMWKPLLKEVTFLLNKPVCNQKKILTKNPNKISYFNSSQIPKTALYIDNPKTSINFLIIQSLILIYS